MPVTPTAPAARPVSYQAPSGTESVDVDHHPEGRRHHRGRRWSATRPTPKPRQHQGEFIGGIAAEVVGKDIDRDLGEPGLRLLRSPAVGFNRRRRDDQGRRCRLSRQGEGPVRGDRAPAGRSRTPEPLDRGRARARARAHRGVRPRLVSVPRGLDGGGHRPHSRELAPSRWRRARCSTSTDVSTWLPTVRDEPARRPRTRADAATDRTYSLRPSGPVSPVPPWDDMLAWDGTTLDTVRR